MEQGGDYYKDLQQPALLTAGCFVLVALLLSMFLIFQHLRCYTNPPEQKWIVGVLLMVPLYATESIISLWIPKLSLICDILRSCYEAFALYCFGSYLVACLGGERRVVEFLENESRRLVDDQPLIDESDKDWDAQPKSFRNFFFRPHTLGKDLFTIIKFGLVQYMILKTICAFLAFVLEPFGVYGNGEFKWYYGYPYLALVMNFSQMWALYCLVRFYNLTHQQLQPIRPLAKFISFKAIVFATWWQGVGIALAQSLGVLPKEGKIESGLQDFLICIEMSVAAVAHVFVFSSEPYKYVPVSEYGKITTETIIGPIKVKDRDRNKEKQAVVEKRETQVEAAGTSVTESVQDIVVEGGQRVVKDVVLTINQAIGPVEKGVAKIQERFHQHSVNSDTEERSESELQVEEVFEEIKS